MSFYGDCTKYTCPVEATIYTYAPALGANATFVALFGFSMIVQAAEGIYFHKVSGLWSYSLPIVLGCITEIIGYAGRLVMWNDPFDADGFYMQICCLTIAPAFLTAGIYFCLSDIIKLFDPNCESSWLKPKMYAWIFIPCDIISLVLQAAGGGVAATSIDVGENPDPGTDTMIAGLAWQVFSLFCFIVLTCDFAFRNVLRRRRMRSHGGVADAGLYEKGHDFGSPDNSAVLDADGSPHATGSPSSENTEWDAEAQRTSPYQMAPAAALKPVDHKKFALWLIPFIVAILTIFMRCCYRVAELSGGWTGHLIHEEGTFIGLEGVLVVVGTLALNICHPAFLVKMRSS
ncbi:hypothetical protein KEM56_007277 [Ascosphaera pollenicola]|nr:hypothetical protein KEM56_007277 [Ascosphaera pollenicola]